MKSSEILRGAARVIRDRGWHQGGRVEIGGDPLGDPCCAGGAITAAYNTLRGQEPSVWIDGGDSPSIRRVRVELVQFVDAPNVISWNDQAGRTELEILVGLDTAAAALEAEGR